MSSKEWKVLPLEDCMEAIIDYRGKTPRKSSYGIPLITAKIVKGGRILEPTEFIPYEDYDDRMSRGIPKVGDIVVTTEAPLGEVGQLDDRKLSVGQRLITLRGKAGLLDNTYLKYMMMSDFVQNQLFARATGTTVSGIKQAELRKIDLLIPPFSTQKRIANILSALDEKIKLNQQTNSTLLAIAQAIFKEWFIDFNFPNKTGKLRESEMGMIPEGWRIGKLEEIISNYDSKRIPISGQEREKRKGIYPYYGAASIVDYIDDFLFDGTYLLMGEDGTVITEEEKPILQFVTGKFWVNNHTHVLRGKGDFSTEFVYLVLNNTNIKHIITGAVQPKINQGNMNNLPVIIPDTGSLIRFQNVVKPIFANVLEIEEQSATIAALLDALLPRLINGEIEV
jgi:type I restriction enzyme S subunit